MSASKSEWCQTREEYIGVCELSELGEGLFACQTERVCAYSTQFGNKKFCKNNLVIEHHKKPQKSD
jgi:hypothetical protein